MLGQVILSVNWFFNSCVSDALWMIFDRSWFLRMGGSNILLQREHRYVWLCGVIFKNKIKGDLRIRIIADNREALYKLKPSGIGADTLLWSAHNSANYPSSCCQRLRWCGSRSLAMWMGWTWQSRRCSGRQFHPLWAKFSVPGISVTLFICRKIHTSFDALLSDWLTDWIFFPRLIRGESPFQSCFTARCNSATCATLVERFACFPLTCFILIIVPCLTNSFVQVSSNEANMAFASARCLFISRIEGVVIARVCLLCQSVWRCCEMFGIVDF